MREKQEEIAERLQKDPWIWRIGSARWSGKKREPEQAWKCTGSASKETFASPMFGERVAMFGEFGGMRLAIGRIRNFWLYAFDPTWDLQHRAGR